MTYIRIAGALALGALSAMTIVTLSLVTTTAAFGFMLYAFGPRSPSRAASAEVAARWQ
jgi:hypothetical protein